MTAFSFLFTVPDSGDAAATTRSPMPKAPSTTFNHSHAGNWPSPNNPNSLKRNQVRAPPPTMPLISSIVYRHAISVGNGS